METTFPATGVPRELPIVGGHLALDFANTVDDPDGTARYDHAGTFPELVAWSVRIGILQPDRGGDAAGLRHGTSPRQVCRAPRRRMRYAAS